MLDKQVAGLHIASQKKKQEALSKVKKAIAFLVDNRQKITVRSVAKEASVSVSYIYKYPELTYSIQRLREQQKYSLVDSKETSESARDEVILLQQKNQQLTEKLDRLIASIERVNTVKKTAKQLQAENIKLTIENQQLKIDLEYARQKLQEARKYILVQQCDGLEKIDNETNLNVTTKISQK
jgi:hypothetical protein